MKIDPISVFGALMFSFTLSLSVPAADIPDSSSGAFRGMYKVVSSNDPLFPVTATTEYFMDFGKGIQGNSMSGNVAVSMRQNPNVKVRIMAWQYFPKQGLIAIGNPYAEGSRNAVARGAWTLTGANEGVVFKRGSYQMVLHRADPGDY